MDQASLQFSAFLREAFEANTPMNMHWDITWRCDHSCVHCYLTDRRKEELTLDEQIGILDQLAEAGTLSLLISGGDPFLRPDALDFLRAARKRHFQVTINTHGNFIDDAVADVLAEIGVHKVNISVYSTDPAEHEAVTRVPGSHAKAVAAGRRLVARGVRCEFRSPVVVQNREGYLGVRALAESIGASWRSDANIVPDDESDFGLCGIGVHSTERIVAMMNAMAPRRDEVVPPAEMPDVPSDRRTCSAGSASGFISPDGTVYPCITWREPIGNLREASFDDLWHHHPTIERQRTVRRASYLQDCAGCTFHGKCDYCPGISHAETGDPERRSAYVCERTHLTMASIEHVHRLNQTGAPIPAPGSPEADALLDGMPTYAERQWAARQAGLTRQADRLAPGLVTIHDPLESAVDKGA